MSVRKCVSHKEEEIIMSRSVAATAAILILSGFVQGQQGAVGQERTHEVIRGETLWALAERYLENPFRWPLIFDANQAVIRNPHLIFPGQIFVIPGLPAEPATVGEVAVRVPDPGQVPEAADVRARVPLVGTELCPGPSNRTIFYGGAERDRGCLLPSPSPSERTAFYRGPESPGTAQPADPTAGEPEFQTVTGEAPGLFPYVPRGLVYAAEWLEDLEGEPESVGVLSSLAPEHTDLPSWDRARWFERLEVVPQEEVHLQVGDLLQSFEVLRSQEGLGQVMRPTGILTVTAVEGDRVEAMLSAQFHRVRLGSKVRRVPDYTPRPGARAEPVESLVTGVVLGFPQDRPIRGHGATAFLDVGADLGIVVGDEFGAFRDATGHPSRTEIARFRVVLVDGERATARIVAVTDPAFHPGTHVRLVGKMR